MGQIKKKLYHLIGLPIVVYQWFVRPILKPCCRFSPSCSDYALTALHTFGVIKGIKMACCRLLRCHPWSEGGYDPVLPNKEKP